ncbi:hypothetical protein SNEBB_010185 [Seison nebaliae]|nr:hypothetical protein SNEBB_010185 [Seison nebaliae]
MKNDNRKSSMLNRLQLLLTATKYHNFSIVDSQLPFPYYEDIDEDLYDLLATRNYTFRRPGSLTVPNLRTGCVDNIEDPVAILMLFEDKNNCPELLYKWPLYPTGEDNEWFVVNVPEPPSSFLTLSSTSSISTPSKSTKKSLSLCQPFAKSFPMVNVGMSCRNNPETSTQFPLHWKSTLSRGVYLQKFFKTQPKSLKHQVINDDKCLISNSGEIVNISQKNFVQMLMQWPKNEKMIMKIEDAYCLGRSKKLKKDETSVAIFFILRSVIPDCLLHIYTNIACDLLDSLTENEASLSYLYTQIESIRNVENRCTNYKNCSQNVRDTLKNFFLLSHTRIARELTLVYEQLCNCGYYYLRREHGKHYRSTLTTILQHKLYNRVCETGYPCRPFINLNVGQFRFTLTYPLVSNYSLLFGRLTNKFIFNNRVVQTLNCITDHIDYNLQEILIHQHWNLLDECRAIIGDDKKKRRHLSSSQNPNFLDEQIVSESSSTFLPNDVLISSDGEKKDMSVTSSSDSSSPVITPKLSSTQNKKRISSDQSNSRNRRKNKMSNNMNEIAISDDHNRYRQRIYVPDIVLDTSSCLSLDNQISHLKLMNTCAQIQPWHSAIPISESYFHNFIEETCRGMMLSIKSDILPKQLYSLLDSLEHNYVDQFSDERNDEEWEKIVKNLKNRIDRHIHRTTAKNGANRLKRFLRNNLMNSNIHIFEKLSDRPILNNIIERFKISSFDDDEDDEDDEKDLNDDDNDDDDDDDDDEIERNNTDYNFRWKRRYLFYRLYSKLNRRYSLNEISEQLNFTFKELQPLFIHLIKLASIAILPCVINSSTRLIINPNISLALDKSEEINVRDVVQWAVNNSMDNDVNSDEYQRTEPMQKVTYRCNEMISSQVMLHRHLYRTTCHHLFSTALQERILTTLHKNRKEMNNDSSLTTDIDIDTAVEEGDNDYGYEIPILHEVNQNRFEELTQFYRVKKKGSKLVANKLDDVNGQLFTLSIDNRYHNTTVFVNETKLKPEIANLSAEKVLCPSAVPFGEVEYNARMLCRTFTVNVNFQYDQIQLPLFPARWNMSFNYLSDRDDFESNHSDFHMNDNENGSPVMSTPSSGRNYYDSSNGMAHSNLKWNDNSNNGYSGNVNEKLNLFSRVSQPNVRSFSLLTILQRVSHEVTTVHDLEIFIKDLICRVKRSILLIESERSIFLYEEFYKKFIRQISSDIVDWLLQTRFLIPLNEYVYRLNDSIARYTELDRYLMEKERNIFEISHLTGIPMDSLKCYVMNRMDSLHISVRPASMNNYLFYI